MMRSYFGFFLLFFNLSVIAQSQLVQIGKNDPNLPSWAEIMYQESPNFNEVIDAYQHYYLNHPFEKTIHTQYFKRWVSAVKANVNPDGTITYVNASEQMDKSREILEKQESDSNRGSSIWHFEGPQHHVVSDGTLTAGFRHSNIYCHDRSTLNENLLFCGSESGGLYKSNDAGQNWEFVSAGLLIGHVSAVRIKPNDDNFVIMSAANDLWRTTNGGIDWEIIGQPAFAGLNISAWEIAYNLENNDIIYAATNEGFFRSTDNGDNWSEILPRNCETISFKPDDPSVVYTIQYENSLGYSRFYKSIDYGLSFTMYDSGWFDSSLGDIDITGGRLATTEADPNRIYALLVGYQTATSEVVTNGWVGTWVSYDAGATWSLPHELIGTPYTEAHPNLMNFNGDDGDYSQIHYNTTLIASQLDPDKIMIGGLNLWMSTDAAATYEGVGGYIGGTDYFHVDQQEYRIYKTSETTEEIWFSNDGGIGHTDDFMESHENLNRGIYAVNLWGYDQGWNEDIMVGGRYHNGNMAYFETYPQGEFLALGGGEAATGYVKYTDENKALFSDIGGYNLPETLDQEPDYFAVGLSPNEHYWNNASSRIMFDNEYYNMAWCGRENKLYKSTNGGGTFGVAYTFGNDVENELYWMEQSYANHNYLYVQQAIGNTSKIWKSTDHGETWVDISLPQSLRSISFTLSAVNPDELWIAYYDGSNGNKIYHTIDGGLNWNNLTTSTLNDQEIWAIAHQYGTDGGVYVAMLHGLVYYRNNDLTDWVSYSAGLPVSTEPLRIVPFLRDNVVRLATWNLGVWEAPAYESSALIADFSAEYGTFFCPGNNVHFVNHSVCSAEATYTWSFQGATPSTSTEPYPTVVYNSPGTYDVTLVVTDNGNSEEVIKTSYVSSQDGSSEMIEEDFEEGFFPDEWINVGNGSWSIGEESAYNIDSYCMKFDNYYYDAFGERDEIWLGKHDFSLPVFSFDVAYAQYDNNYSDTLAILYSTDCGDSWTEVFQQGGDDLATAPDNNQYFVPDATQWENHLMEIAPIADGNEVIFAFQNRGHYGNVIYVDNINVAEAIPVAEQTEEGSQINIFPNPAKDRLRLSAKGMLPGNYRIQVLEAQGKLMQDINVISVGTHLERVINVENYPSGIYFLHLFGSGFNESYRIEVKD